MSALDVQCIFCGAKPGWHCIGAPTSGRPGQRVSPHWVRVTDSKTAEAVGHRAGKARYDLASVADAGAVPAAPASAAPYRPVGPNPKPTPTPTDGTKPNDGPLPGLSPTDLWMEHQARGYER